MNTPNNNITESNAQPKFVDFSIESERERLSASAIGAYANIMDVWNITEEDARVVFGGMSHGNYHNHKKKPENYVLSQDRLTRVSYCIGIFKALNIIYDQELADKWMTLPNKNKLFRGTTPFEFIKQGGIPAFLEVRKLVDGRRGGK